MLILIAGITGNIGQHAAAHGIKTGHQIRGLGRNPSKLPPSTLSKLESFITTTSHADTAALDKACTGVDAIICAYSGTPQLHLEGQLLLLRAAERAGIKRFLAASWNYDWRNIQFGDEPVYDAIMAFHRQVEISSTIRPLHIFSGMLAEVFFGVEGQDGFTPRDGGVWDPKAKSLDIWGDGKGEWCFTTESDAGKWGVEVVVADGAEEGGFITVCSWRCSLLDVKRVYEQVRAGTDVQVNYKGSLEQFESLAIKEKEELGYRNMWEWHRWWFLLYSLKGVWNLSDVQNDQYQNVVPTSLVEFLEQNPQI